MQNSTAKNVERQATADGCQAWNDASECKTRLQNSAKTFFKAQRGQLCYGKNLREIVPGAGEVMLQHRSTD